MAMLMFMAGDRMREVETWWVSDALPARWKAGCVTLLVGDKLGLLDGLALHGRNGRCLGLVEASSINGYRNPTWYLHKIDNFSQV
jgi:hypothetical protein